jgi:hypothetical protein
LLVIRGGLLGLGLSFSILLFGLFLAFGLGLRGAFLRLVLASSFVFVAASLLLVLFGDFACLNIALEARNQQ